jgi:hypothetical protein
MADNGALYAIIGGLAVAVAGGGLYIAHEHGAFDSRTIAAVTAPAAVPVPAPSPAPAQPSTPAPPAADASQVPGQVPGQITGQIQRLIVDARRAITRGDLKAADRALDQAERLEPRSSDVAAARNDLQRAQQQAQRVERGVDLLVERARAAIARRDYAAADRLLDQAESIDARDRDVQQARAELDTAQRKPDRGRDNDTGPGRR